MLRRVVVIMTSVSAVMLGLLLVATTPLSAGPLGILGFFVFLYITTLGVLTFLFRGISLVAPKFRLSPKSSKAKSGLPFRKAYYYASVIALAPIMIIAMQSVAEIGVYQVLLVGFFSVIAWVYVSNRTL